MFIHSLYAGVTSHSFKSQSFKPCQCQGTLLYLTQLTQLCDSLHSLSLISPDFLSDSLHLSDSHLSDSTFSLRLTFTDCPSPTHKSPRLTFLYIMHCLFILSFSVIYIAIGSFTHTNHWLKLFILHISLAYCQKYTFIELNCLVIPAYLLILLLVQLALRHQLIRHTTSKGWPAVLSLQPQPQ